MDRVIILVIVTSSILLTSCTPRDISSSYPFLTNDEEFHVFILFSSDNYLDEEYNYYDALINFQQNHPDKLSNVNIVTAKDQKLIDYYNISTFPTLLLVNDLEVELKLEGSQDLSYIYKKLELTILQKEDKEAS